VSTHEPTTTPHAPAGTGRLTRANRGPQAKKRWLQPRRRMPPAFQQADGQSKTVMATLGSNRPTSRQPKKASSQRLPVKSTRGKRAQRLVVAKQPDASTTASPKPPPATSAAINCRHRGGGHKRSTAVIRADKSENRPHARGRQSYAPTANARWRCLFYNGEKR